MKFSLTITDANASDIQRIMALLSSGTAAGTIAPMPSPGIPATPATGDDETGPANPNAPATDSAGMPWDERIHSSNKAQNADGSWRKRRGVSDATVSAVEKELTERMMHEASPGTMPAPQPAAPAAPPPIGIAPVALPGITAPTAPMPPVATVPAMPAAPAPAPVPPMPPVAPETPVAPAPQPAPAPAAPQAWDFNTFMQGLSGQMQANSALTPDYIAGLTQRISQAYGINPPLSAITDLLNHPDKIAYTVQTMQSEGMWK